MAFATGSVFPADLIARSRSICSRSHALSMASVIAGPLRDVDYFVAGDEASSDVVCSGSFPDKKLCITHGNVQL